MPATPPAAPAFTRPGSAVAFAISMPCTVHDAERGAPCWSGPVTGVCGDRLKAAQARQAVQARASSAPQHEGRRQRRRTDRRPPRPEIDDDLARRAAAVRAEAAERNRLRRQRGHWLQDHPGERRAGLSRGKGRS